MRRKASWRVSTPRMAVIAGESAGVLAPSCCWNPMTLPKLAEVRRLATARNSSKFVAGNVYLHGGTTGAELRRRTASVVATWTSSCCFEVLAGSTGELEKLCGLESKPYCRDFCDYFHSVIERQITGIVHSVGKILECIGIELCLDIFERGQ